MNSKTKKIMGAALSLTMATTIAASQIITYAKEPTSSANSFDSVKEVSFYELTDSIDLSHIVQDNLSDKVVNYGEQEEIRNITGQNATKTVIISLKTQSISETKGDDMSVAEYLSTAAGEKALTNIRNSQTKLLSDIAAAGIAYKEVARYSTVINAVAIEINTAQFNKIRKLPGVSMAGVSKTYAAPTAVDREKLVTNYSKIYGTGIYDSTEIMEKYNVDGSGITVAILDTGLDYTHEAFSYDPEGEVAFEKSDIVNRINEGNLVAAQRTPGLSADDVYLSAKVPFAYDYSDNDTDVYTSYNQHGVHVAGIVAGKAKTYIDKDGNVVDDPDVEYDFMGVAPNAQLVICKVFTDDLDSEDLGGATSEDLIAALDDCVTLGVDIINMSLGTTSGFSNLSIEGDAEGEQLRLCYENIKKEGVSLIAAAGNEFSSGYGSEFGTNLASNPDSGTVGSPSTFIGSLSVASVNGQKAPFMLANPGEDSAYGDYPIYYGESNDANAVPFDFAEDMLGDKESGIFTYFVVPGAGENGDYSTVRDRISSYKAEHPGEKVLVVVRRGKTDFKNKVSTAKSNGADGIIVYNNVPGTIRMSLSDINIEQQWIPSASINVDAGALLTIDPKNPGRLRTEGKIEINKTYSAGPFMNDYSSWGASPDLDLKPEITSHGGEITSAVAGGYEEMSGTSMATPNLAGLMALVRGYLKTKHPDYTPAQLTTLSNQIVMSSATLLFNEQNLPYSPRKQGAGLATLRNIFTTQAYLSTETAEDNRPKIELRDDKTKKGEYSFTFNVTNFGDSALNFKLVSRFFTEQLAADGLAVAETAHMFGDIPAEFTVSGSATKNGDMITVNANGVAQIGVSLKLSAAEKSYLDKSFKNGMYVEGFISLESDGDVENGGQCSLNLPFMGFYGDWRSAPMLDYNAYEIAEIQQDTSIVDSEKPHESVFATQLFSTYYNGKYGVPMGGYAYVQDEEADQIYVSEEHCAISRFNIYQGETAKGNYMTSTGVRALYAGLLRNAELVTYDIYNVSTGEKVYEGEKYRVGKAYANGGSAVPALVDMKLDTEALGLINNEKYSIEFNFYMKAADRGTEVSYANEFTSTFYVDYDAPVMQGSRIRYYNYKVGNDIKQRVYLDIDIYDNHYPQSVLLCYSNEEYKPGDIVDPIEINLATEYVTPIYNPVRNGVNTVEIEITDIYQEYRNRLYVQLDDYALNHTVYGIDFSTANTSSAESDFEFVLNDRVTKTQNASGVVSYNLTIEKNEMYRVELNSGNANASNYTWRTSNQNRISLRNNEIFGLSATTTPARVSVTGGGKTLTLNVTVVDSNRTLPAPTLLTFGVIEDENKALVKATGNVKVNAGQTFNLKVESEPWYYPVNTLDFTWSSSNEALATVDQNGTVTTNNTRGTVSITATTILPNGSSRSAQVTLNIQEPFRISNMTLTRYYGSEEVVKIPDDKNVMYIGEEAFEDNNTMRVLIIPKTVIEINARAFLNCTALEEIYFIEKTNKGDEPLADLAKVHLIYEDAFKGCTNLKLVDLTNVKVVTLSRNVFAGCESLEEVRYSQKIGTAHDFAFRGCTALEEIDITGLHMAGNSVFQGCTNLKTVETGHYTAIGSGMFYNCTSLTEITIHAPRVDGGVTMEYWMMDEDDEYTIVFPYGGGAFENCTNLSTVNFSNESDGKTWTDTEFRIDDYAFAGCKNLSAVNFNGLPVSYIGDYAFSRTALTNLTVYGTPVLGNNIFAGVNGTVNLTFESDKGYTQESNGAIYCGTTLVLAPATITSSFAIKAGTTEIAPYAFSGSKFEVNTIAIPDTVETIGEGAFNGAKITSITIPSKVTYIPEKAFAMSSLTSITIPATVKEIGASAFANCRSLGEITISNGVETIGSYAFSNTGIQSITLPESVKVMGDSVFENCHNLTEAHLSSLISLGDYTFFGCENLATASFGQNAKASGNYTFYTGAYFNYQTEKIEYLAGALTTVDLGGLEELGECVFWHCANLTSIDLKNVTKVGMGAFSDCGNLITVTNIEKLTNIGDHAFAGTALPKINLESAKEIGDQAFYNVEATAINFPVAVSIGRQAFAGSLIFNLQIPATLEKLGAGAFMSSYNLNTVKVEEGNDIFFVKDNVLYRIIENAKTSARDTYELCLYPSALYATENEQQAAHYRVIDGTVTIQAFAFAYLNPGALSSVTLPYSLKTIGAFAFFNRVDGVNTNVISRYNFESIAAPALLSEYYDLFDLDPNNINLTVFRSMYYANFYNELIWYVGEVGYSYPTTTVLAYPSNGTGYQNYVYSLYFGTNVSLGELKEDDIRTIIKYVDSFDIDVINSWMSLPNNAANKAMVEEFSEKVKEAHRLYNNYAARPIQIGYLNEGVNRAEKLFAVEAALKPVKAHFGISVKISSVRVAESSKHKSIYKIGEEFDMTGLVIEVIYDDYSTELVSDISLMTLETKGALYDFDTSVDVRYAGSIFRVPVEVTAEGGSDTPPPHGGGEDKPNPPTPVDSGCAGCGSMDIGSTLGGTGLLLLTLAGAIVLMSKVRRKANK